MIRGFCACKVQYPRSVIICNYPWFPRPWKIIQCCFHAKFMQFGQTFLHRVLVAGILGIDDVYAEVLPENKSEIIKEYQMKGDFVMFSMKLPVSMSVMMNADASK